MAGTYKNFIKLLESWPLDKSKSGRDLGHYIREQIKLGFAPGKIQTKAEKEQCDRYYVSLQRISSNHYANLYPRKLNSSATSLNSGQCHFALSSEFSQQLELHNRSLFQKVKDKFANNGDTDKKVADK
ncbi:ubiquinol-cytochrome-c reductase complex assembly factor 2 [Microplitis mediator]|uniref:ubiquinol-cytochrome-c reductase complex assembly factor 2 n=1 Tax=Microplitis mediator TaxID=375433 RepID=UPI0025555614|nr:ubiquinol-cytochrome-c reductase complex assembly factor 2 [Microplitis mediator]